MGSTIAHAQTKPTVVLVHGSLRRQQQLGRCGRRPWPAMAISVVGIANSLRGVANDATAVRTLIDAIPGPVILVGHSYGGAVISAAADWRGQRRGPGLCRGVRSRRRREHLRTSRASSRAALCPRRWTKPVNLPGGAHDLYIAQDKFPRPSSPPMSRWPRLD
ncbi:alpha/beta hydrolase [Caulobacter segnis]